MCGITGFWDRNSTLDKAAMLALSEKMADQIDHRGPDSFGIWVDEKAGLAFGHRRLSIVDLSEAGHQPMVSSASQLVLSYNGEIYNTAELREELILAGQSFAGHSDTEVILKACEAWGVEKTAERLLGMFAFSLWNPNTQTLYLVRDRLGKKPLYWGIQNNVLFFGSQIKSFVPHPSWKPEIDKNSLASYFRFNYVPAPISIFKGLYKLSPGSILKFNKNWEKEEIRFWDFQKVVSHGLANPFEASEPELIEQADILLRDAVKRRMMADVPLGAFLSGGIDSSTVVALMQAQSNQAVKTFSIGFKEQDYNEAEYAKKVAQYLGTEHHELYVEPKDIFGIIPKIPDWFDEPFADSSQIPTYLVSKIAREHVTVALSGDGGDEVFAGYTRYLQGNRAWQTMKLIPAWLKYCTASFICSISPKTWDACAKAIPRKIRPSAFADKVYKLAKVLQISDPKDFYKRLVSQWQEPNQLVLGAEEPILFPWQGLDIPGNLNIVEYMQVMDTLTYLPDDILAKVDRASMALGLEARVPLLDHRVVEFAWRLPFDKKIRNNQGKYLLRSVLSRYIPKTLIERPKMGFGIPIDGWLRNELRVWAEELLFDASLKQEGILNLDLIHRTWNEHQSGARNWQYPIWGVLMFLAWKRKWKF